MTANGESAQSLGADANLLMIIQVPLKYRAPAARGDRRAPASSRSTAAWQRRPPPPRGQASEPARRSSDVDTAVLGHGPSSAPTPSSTG